MLHIYLFCIHPNTAAVCGCRVHQHCTTRQVTWQIKLLFLNAFGSTWRKKTVQRKSIGFSILFLLWSVVKIGSPQREDDTYCFEAHEELFLKIPVKAQLDVRNRSRLDLGEGSINLPSRFLRIPDVRQRIWHNILTMSATSVFNDDDFSCASLIF